jgi:hypothetical protein
MDKRPGSGRSAWLTVRGWYAAFREAPGKRSGVRYELIIGERRRLLSDVQCGDWSATGRLLVATADGRLQIRDVDRSLSVVSWE